MGVLYWKRLCFELLCFSQTLLTLINHNLFTLNLDLSSLCPIPILPLYWLDGIILESVWDYFFCINLRVFLCYRLFFRLLYVSQAFLVLISSNLLAFSLEFWPFCPIPILLLNWFYDIIHKSVWDCSFFIILEGLYCCNLFLELFCFCKILLTFIRHSLFEFNFRLPSLCSISVLPLYWFYNIIHESV